MIRYIDLFAGIGGFHQAMSQVFKDQVQCVFASEWDRNCQAVYYDNYGMRPVGDITKVEAKDISPHDVLCAGFPCQPFSIAGKKLGFADTRGTLFHEIIRIAKHHKPKVMLLENVKNLVGHDKGKTLNTILNHLNLIGYNVTYKVLNASHFGVPQARKRIYIVCLLDQTKSFEILNFSGGPTKLQDFLLDDDDIDNKLIIDRKDITMKDIVITPDAQGNYPQKPIRIGSVYRGGQGYRIYSILGHAVTQCSQGGGCDSGTGIYETSKGIRQLDPHECAKISGFPDNFKLHPKRNVCYKQFGNTVVVPVLVAILEKLKREGLI
jgi:DNA (cytosine-5)-methyltransferase 1